MLVLCVAVVITETSRLLLRQLCSNDAEAMAGVFGDAEVMRFGDGVRTSEWVRSWIGDWVNEYYARWGFGAWAVVEKATMRVMGYCGLSRFPGRCAAGETEIGFRLARAYWGRGFATEAALAVHDYAFVTLHIPRLIALIDPENVPSLRVVEKIGLRYEQEIMLPGYDHPDRLYAAEVRPL